MTIGATDTRKSCPTGCSRTVRDGHLMCPACWREVPRDLQRNVHSTWRRWRRDLGNRDLSKNYREAADAAVGSVR